MSTRPSKYGLVPHEIGVLINQEGKTGDWVKVAAVRGAENHLFIGHNAQAKADGLHEVEHNHPGSSEHLSSADFNSLNQHPAERLAISAYAPGGETRVLEW